MCMPALIRPSFAGGKLSHMTRARIGSSLLVKAGAFGTAAATLASALAATAMLRRLKPAELLREP